MSDNPVQHDFDDELLSAYLDDELAADQRALVEARLRDDPAARQMLDQLRQVSQAVRGLPPDAPSGDLRDAILRRVADANSASTSPESHDATPALPKFTIGRTRRGWIWASLAVAAALLIMFVQREPSKDDSGRSVAHHRREPASLTAAPEAARPAPSQPAARGLAETETAMPMTAGSGVSGANRSASTEELAAAPPSQPVEPIDEDELVVVHVLAKRKAIKDRTFDQLLVSNGIAVEPEAPAESADELADRSRALASSSRAAERGPAQPVDDEADVDVVLVEAPPVKIKSCLAELNRDSTNYLGVSVDESAPADKAPTPQAVPTKKLAMELQQYNRGSVPQRQKEFLARNKAYYFEPSPAGDYFGLGSGVGGTLDAAGGGEIQDKQRLANENAANQARAQRLLVSKTERRLAGQLGKLPRQGKALTAPDSDNLQVLFVLAPGDEPPASPAAHNSTE